jgi:spore coat protein JB
MNVDPDINMIVETRSSMSQREKALWLVQAYEFAIAEVALFLNTHPKDQTALSYFVKYRDMKHQVEADYTRRFGPLTMDHVDNDLSTWRWIENPWPWEIGSGV